MAERFISIFYVNKRVCTYFYLSTFAGENGKEGNYENVELKQ